MMSVIDKFLDVMRLNSDEDYDEFYNDDFEMEEDEPERKKPSRRERKEESNVVETVKEKPVKSTPKITPITKSNRKQVLGMEVCVIKPSSMEDEIEITDTLLNGRTVVSNMEGLDVDLAQRIIDFTSGSTYAMHGNLQKISNYIFLATPNGVDISGDIQNLMESFDGTSFTV